MSSGVNLYGGFPPSGNPGLSDRDPDAYPTILDGDGEASPILEYEGSVNHEIDGVTFTDAEGENGGAISVTNFSNVQIVNCRFIANNAQFRGAAIYVAESNADIENCILENNTAGDGAALYVDSGTARLVKCQFRGNWAGARGGAIKTRARLEVDQCAFEENLARRGGAIEASFGFRATITNSLFRENEAEVYGGGMSIEGQDGVVVANCTFVDNIASDAGGGLYSNFTTTLITNCIFVNNDNHAIFENHSSRHPTIINNLFFNNPDALYYDQVLATVESTEGAGGLNTVLAEAHGNLDGDPLFLSAEDGDYHLRGASPAIDAGTADGAPLIDIDGEARPVDVVLVANKGGDSPFDIGYDEYLDTDGDEIPDYWEIRNGLDPGSSVGDDGALGDPDRDGVSNFDEYALFNSNASGPVFVDNDGGSDLCFIATAAYGTPMAGEIDVLRGVRDSYMLESVVGTAFVDSYYRLSPPIAQFIAQYPAVRLGVRVVLAPVVLFSKVLLVSPLAGGLVMLVAGLVITRLGIGRLRRFLGGALAGC